MPSVELSERAYREAEAAAVAEGVSLAEYVEQLIVDDEEPVALTAEQLSLVREGQEQIRAGLGLTQEEFDRRHAERKAAWRTEHGL